MILVGAVPRAGDEPAVAVMDAVGKLHRLDVIASEIQPAVGEEAREHVGIVPHPGAKHVGGLAGLKNADTHVGPLVRVGEA